MEMAIHSPEMREAFKFNSLERNVDMIFDDILPVSQPKTVSMQLVEQAS